MMAACTQTVSILYALFFGAGEACVRIDLWSILSAFAVFMVVVVMLQWIARRMWGRLTSTPQTEGQDTDTQPDRPFEDNPHYRDSAIRSTRR